MWSFKVQDRWNDEKVICANKRSWWIKCEKQNEVMDTKCELWELVIFSQVANRIANELLQGKSF